MTSARECPVAKLGDRMTRLARLRGDYDEAICKEKEGEPPEYPYAPLYQMRRASACSEIAALKGLVEVTPALSVAGAAVQVEAALEIVTFMRRRAPGDHLIERVYRVLALVNATLEKTPAGLPGVYTRDAWPLHCYRDGKLGKP